MVYTSNSLRERLQALAHLTRSELLLQLARLSPAISLNTTERAGGTLQNFGQSCTSRCCVQVFVHNLDGVDFTRAGRHSLLPNFKPNRERIKYIFR